MDEKILLHAQKTYVGIGRLGKDGTGQQCYKNEDAQRNSRRPTNTFIMARGIFDDAKGIERIIAAREYHIAAGVSR